MADGFNPYYYFNSPTVMTELRKLLCDYKKGKILIKELIAKTENLDKHIADIIQKMYDDGDFDRILTEIITPLINEIDTKLEIEFNKKLSVSQVGTLDFERYFRDIFVGKNYTLLNSVTFNGAFLQGGVVYELNGSTKFCGAFVDPRLEDDAGAMLKNYANLNSTSHTESGKLSIGHANGMTYNYEDNTFYIAPSTEYLNGEGVEATHIFAIDPISFSVTQYNISEYSPDISYYNGKLYVINTHDNFKVYSYNYTTGNCTYVSTLQVDKQGVSSFYNFDVADDKVFLVDTTGKRIEVFDLATGSLLKVYSIPLYDKQHRFLIKEIESITAFDDGRLFISTTGWNGLNSQGQEIMTSVFCGNFKTNNPEPILKYSDTITGGNVVCVKMSSEPSANLIITTGSRPDGTTSAPFATITEAVDYINANPNWTHCRIRLGGDHVLSASVSSNKSIDIISWDFTANSRPVKNYFIGGLFCESFTNLFLFFIDLWCSNTQYEFEGCLTAYNSTIHSYGLNTHTTKTEVMKQTTYDVDIEGSYYRYSDANDTFSQKKFTEASTHVINNSQAVAN